jgi:enoyl-CoA hydratase/carnithine racemase
VSARLAELRLSDPRALVGPARELCTARAEAEADPQVWAVLIRAAGPDTLATARLESGSDPAAAALTPWAKPLILAVAGEVSGAGLALAGGADVLVATPTSSFLLASPEAGGAAREALLRCSTQLPYRMVTALTMARRPLSAERAHELGFVNELADEDSLEATVAEWAAAIVAAPPLAAEAIRLAAAEGLGKDLAAAIGDRYGAVERYAGSADAAEAVAALLEGRRPLWRGH